MKRITYLLTTFFILLQCGKVNEETKREAKVLKNTIASNEVKYDRNVNKYKKLLRPHINAKKSINQKNKYFIKLKLYKYNQTKKSLPTNASQFKQFIGKVPTEIFTGSSRISFVNDKKGGWYINLKKKEVYINWEIK